jgi:ABC-type lipoprotein release transport system permease subunit
MLNIKLLEYALISIKTRKQKTAFILAILTILVAICSTTFTITGALKEEAKFTVNSMPHITVQKHLAGSQQFIESYRVDEILELPGVKTVNARIWGYYYFEYLNTHLTIVGIDPFEPQTSKYLEQVTNNLDHEILNEENAMVTGSIFAETISKIYGKNSFNFVKPDGEYVEAEIRGTFKPETNMTSTGTLIMNADLAREILGIPEDMAMDIAVNLSNHMELETIAEKIKSAFPDSRTVSKDVIAAHYQNMFDYKGGIFLLFFLMSAFTFFVIVYDKTSGLSFEEKREIAILKAIGWSVSDILTVKLYESLVISVTSFLAGILVSMVYIFGLNAPGLKNIFMGYAYLKPHFELTFYIDLSAIVLIFFATIPIYTASILIPAWRSAVIDAEEIIR